MPVPDYPPTSTGDAAEMRRQIRALWTELRSRAAIGPPTINRYTANHTLVLADVGALAQMDKATPLTLTLPRDSAVPIAVGRSGTWVQWGAGLLTLAAGAGVTLRSPAGGLASANRYSEGRWTKTAADEFWITGDLT